jgi:N-acetylmuramoyl-L-alanine amidase
MDQNQNEIDRPGPPQPPLSRRNFLSAMASGALLASLSGCTSSEQNNESSAATYSQENTPPPAPTYDETGNPEINPEVSPEMNYAPPADFQIPSYQPPPPVAQPGPWGIIPRNAWTTAGLVRSNLEPMGGVRLITFHHTGDPRQNQFDEYSYEATAAFWEKIRRWHVQGRNFGDIGYHFGIDLAGRVWQLRPLEFRGAHVRDGNRPPHWCEGNEYLQRGYNYTFSPLSRTGDVYQWNDHNIGVVSIGNFDYQHPTPQQKQKIVEFGSMLRRQYNIPVYRCYTHQELVSELCPGYNLQPYMEYIRRSNIL